MTDTHILAPAIGSALWTESKPTAFLRWSAGKLQQRWSIEEHGGPDGGSHRLEWRDVPTDDTDAGFPTATKDRADG